MSSILTSAPISSHGETIHGVLRQIRAETGTSVESLEVACDGEVLMVQGNVPSFYVWQLAFTASRNAARKYGGLLLDCRIQTVPTWTPPFE